MNKKYCSACQRELKGKMKYFTIRSETTTYSTCAMCILNAINRLRNSKERTADQDELLQKLDQLTDK